MRKNQYNRFDFNPDDVIYMEDDKNIMTCQELMNNINEIFLDLKEGDYVLLKGRKQPVKIKYTNYKILDKYVVDYAGVLKDNDTNLILFNSNNIEKILNIDGLFKEKSHDKSWIYSSKNIR